MCVCVCVCVYYTHKRTHLVAADTHTHTHTHTAVLLEMVGHRTQVFEFIHGTHTTENTMMTAMKRSDPSPQPSPEAQPMRNRLAQLFKFH